MESPQRPEQHRPKPYIFEHVLSEVGRALDDLALSRQTAAEQIAALRAKTAELERHVADLDGRFTKILEERFKQAEPNTPTPEIQQRLDLADELKSVFRAVDQQLRPIYTRAFNGQLSDKDRAARLSVFLNALLGNGDWPLVQTELRQFGLDKQTYQSLEALVGRIEALCQHAAELDPQHKFVFECSQGLLNPSFQKPWMTCDPEGEIAFAVTPAYFVRDRLFLHQEVFTTSRQHDPAAGASAEGSPAV